MPRYSIDNIISKTLDGIRTAHSEYCQWSNGYWIVDGPEYFITTAIARKIAGIRDYNLRVTMEHSIRSTLKEAGGLKRGRPSSRHQLSGRFDIVVWRKNDRPRCAIEVKNRVTGFSDLRSDVERLSEGLLQKNTFQCGLVAFCCGAETKNYSDGRKKESTAILNERIDSILDNARILLQGNGRKLSLKKRLVEKDEDYGCMAAVIKISKN